MRSQFDTTFWQRANCLLQSLIDFFLPNITQSLWKIRNHMKVLVKSPSWTQLFRSTERLRGREDVFYSNKVQFLVRKKCLFIMSSCVRYIALQALSTTSFRMKCSPAESTVEVSSLEAEPEILRSLCLTDNALPLWLLRVQYNYFLCRRCRSVSGCCLVMRCCLLTRCPLLSLSGLPGKKPKTFYH